MAIVTTDDKHYTDIANAIREKTGATKKYKPAEMAEQVNAVYLYGHMAGVVDGEEAVFPVAYEHGKAEMHNLWLNRALTELDEPDITEIPNYQFLGMTKMEKVYCPNVETVGVGALRDCGYFRLDFPKATAIAELCFSYTSTFTALILRKGTLCTLGNKNAFTNTRIANGNGYIYVPSSLKSEYESATNWSNYAAQFRAIEDYPNLDNENALQIVQQPADATWTLNKSATFTVDVIGDGLLYRWFIDKQDGNGWVRSTYSGNATNTQPIGMYDGRQGWKLYCEVTDAYGHMVKSNVVGMVVEE